MRKGELLKHFTLYSSCYLTSFSYLCVCLFGRLWHQLTIKLEELVANPYFDKGTELVTLYENFIREFETKINQLRFVRIVLSILRQITDLNQAASFLQSITDRINSNTEKQAYSLCLSELALIKLRLQQVNETTFLLSLISSSFFFTLYSLIKPKNYLRRQQYN